MKKELNARKNRVIKKIIIPILIFIISLIFFIFILYLILNSPSNPEKNEYIIKINKGMPVSLLIQDLHNKKLIKNKTFFKFISKINTLSKKLTPGYYKLKKGMTSNEILKTFLKGNVIRIKIVIPEGYTILQIAEKFESEGICNKEDFLKLAFSPDFLKKLNIPFNSLEGFLFPATYLFPYKAEAELIIKEMIKNFFSATSNFKQQSNGLSFNETIILASIIEGETYLEEEKPIIASVYLNRLRKNMNLESCVTIKYIKMPQIIELRKKILELTKKLKNESENLRKKQIQKEIDILTKRATIITFNDLKIQNKYNTYINPGLPPAPVCNPGFNSIKAAFQPAKTDYLFFFWDPDKKTHIFSKTYSEHLKKLNSIRRYSRSFASEN